VTARSQGKHRSSTSDNKECKWSGNAPVGLVFKSGLIASCRYDSRTEVHKGRPESGRNEMAVLRQQPLYFDML
jgi:hypothetical protein